MTYQNANHDAAIRLLPLYGTIRLPSLTTQVLKDNAALGANTVLVCITEEDFLYYRENITKVIILARMMGFRVYANAWGYGGLVGGEALSATDLLYKLSGQKQYLNSVHRIGPDAPITNSANAITDSPVFQLKRMQDLVAAAGAEAFFYDEIKIARPRRDDPGHISLEMFLDLAEHAHSLGLRNSLCVAVSSDHDIELLEQLAGYDVVDEISFTHYYAPGVYQPNGRQYLGPSIERVKAAVALTGRDISLMGWAQGFDLGDRQDVLLDTAAAWREFGITNLGIWGGFCVNETPMLTTSGHRYLYKEIAQVFGGPENGPTGPYSDLALDINA